MKTFERRSSKGVIETDFIELFSYNFENLPVGRITTWHRAKSPLDRNSLRTLVPTGPKKSANSSWELRFSTINLLSGANYPSDAPSNIRRPSFIYPDWQGRSSCRFIATIRSADKKWNFHVWNHRYEITAIDNMEFCYKNFLVAQIWNWYMTTNNDLSI